MSMFQIKTSMLTLGLAALAGLAGCGAPVESTSVTPPAAPPAKAMLMEVASSGELGSGASLIRDSLTELHATEPAKADELLKDLDQLEGMGDSAKIKAKAKAMADKL